jgi:hypothetical protein
MGSRVQSGAERPEWDLLSDPWPKLPCAQMITTTVCRRATPHMGWYAHEGHGGTLPGEDRELWITRC